MGKQWKQWQTLFFWVPKSLQMVTAAMKLKRRLFTPWKRSYDQPRQHIKKQRHYFANKGPSSQCYGFSSSHVWMWELDYKESWTPKNRCSWLVVLKTLESPLEGKEIKSVHPKGNQSWIFRKDWCWSWNSNTLATWCGELTHLKRPRCWERLRAGAEGDDRGWDGWIASPIQWTRLSKFWELVMDREAWCAATSCLGLQRVRTERLNWIELKGHIDGILRKWGWNVV